MSLRGACRCNNICLTWKNIDFSLVPRQCGCNYCSVRSAAYVSKSGSAVSVSIRNRALYRVSNHGSGQAGFHECAHCGDVVLVSAEIDDELYCAINVNCLQDRHRFPAPVQINFSNQSPELKLARWRDNWCYPLRWM